MKDRLPETAEGLQGEKLSPLRSSPEDLPATPARTGVNPLHLDMESGEYNQEQLAEYVEAELPESLSQQAVQDRCRSITGVRRSE